MNDFEPLVLLVEDDDRMRRLQVELLELHGFAAVSASSKQDAVRQFAAIPTIDLLITDINLSDPDRIDMSGLDLVREVKRLRPDLPIVGYSGAFDEEDIEETDELFTHFTSLRSKGSTPHGDFDEEIKEWKAVAVQYRDKRIKRANAELQRIIERYRIDEFDFQLLREFIPSLSVPPVPEGTSAEERTTDKSVDDVLRTAGYKLRIIEKGETFLDEEDSIVVVQTPIPIWLRTSDNCVICEVYNFQDLYAPGETEDEAIQQLLMLMHGYYSDLRGDQDSELEAQLLQMRDYLRRVFE